MWYLPFGEEDVRARLTLVFLENALDQIRPMLWSSESHPREVAMRIL